MAGPYDIIPPVSGQPVSSSLFGARVKAGVDDLDLRVALLESSNPAILPICKLTAVAPAQVLLDAQDTVITFPDGSELFDTAGWHNVSVNNSRITVDRDGFYEVRAHLVYAFNTTLDYGDVAIRQNGAVVARSGNLKLPRASLNAANQVNVNAVGGQLVETFAVASGTYFEMSGIHNSSGDVSQTLNTGVTGTRFTVQYLGGY